MKGIILYYSGTGNTKLACQYIKSKIDNIDFELHDLVKNKIPDLEGFDIIGFATFTVWCSIPQYLYIIFKNMNTYTNKYCFLFNTYGWMPGNTLIEFAELVRTKKFKIVLSHSLHTPESFPPQRLRYMAFNKSPNKKEFKNFNDFISNLNLLISEIKNGQSIHDQDIKISFLNKLLPKFKNGQSKQNMGKQNVNVSKCKQCNVCVEICPCNAIKLEPFPIFDHLKCLGCWACYNQCLKKAIFTKKYKGLGQYSKPIPALKEKLQL